MIIWNGLGFLAGVIGFGFMIATQYLTGLAFDDQSYYQAHGWPKMAACFAAAVPVYFLGHYLNVKRARVLMDPETGEDVVLANKHSLFFIPMQHWAILYVVLGIVMMFVKK